MLFKVWAFLFRTVLAGKSTFPNRTYDGLAHMASSWLFMTSLNPCYVSLTELLHLHFLDVYASWWVVNEPAHINGGFGAAFCPPVFVPDGLL